MHPPKMCTALSDQAQKNIMQIICEGCGLIDIILSDGKQKNKVSVLLHTSLGQATLSCLELD